MTIRFGPLTLVVIANARHSIIAKTTLIKNVFMFLYFLLGDGKVQNNMQN